MIFRKSRIEPLPITMSGVRMGERLLQIGIDDPSIAGAIAAKVGLSGNAAMVLSDERSAERAREAATRAGVLADIQVAPLHTLPFAGDSFDVVVINGVNGLLVDLDEETRNRLLRESHRVLRTGGRLMAMEAGPRSGLKGWVRRLRVNEKYEGAGGSVGALQRAGFKAVRVVGQREGYTFTEGLKT